MNFNTQLLAKSINHTIAVINTVATKTIAVDCCNSDQVGQVTLLTNSSYDSLK